MDAEYADILSYTILPLDQSSSSERLLAVRSAFEKHDPLFPENRCILASFVAARLIPEIVAVHGDYRPPHRRNQSPLLLNGEYFGFSRKHALLYNPVSSQYYDLTQDQFVKTLPPVVILPENTPVFERENVFPRFRFSDNERLVANTVTQTLLSSSLFHHHWSRREKLFIPE